MARNLSDTWIRVANIERHEIYSCSRNNNPGLKYFVVDGNGYVLYSCANYGAGDDLEIRWRYRGGHGPEPVLPSAVVEFVEELVSSETSEDIDHYNAALARRGVPEHSWARHEMAVAV